VLNPHPFRPQVRCTGVHRYQTQIPAMRLAHDDHSRSPETPIYDALCAEYRRLFRALPGDRTGEEKLRFEAIMSRHIGGLPPLGLPHLRLRRGGQPGDSDSH
jgi:hypothetical protein